MTGVYMAGNLRAAWHGVSLGRGARISPRCEVRGVAFIGDATLASAVKIGPGTYIGSGSIDSGTIGAFCSIGYRVLVGPTEHSMAHWTMSPVLLRALAESDDLAILHKPVPLIGCDVWIGAAAIVLRGAVIGDGAVIAAGAVVRGRVPAYEVWGGVPARRLRRRFVTQTDQAMAIQRLRAALTRLNIDIERWSVPPDEAAT